MVGYRQKISKNSKETWLFTYTKYSQKYEPTENDPRKDWKISTSTGGTETILWNRCSYQVPSMVGTNASTNENHKFYNSTVRAISRGGGDCATKVGSLCAHFVDTGSLVKTQVENGLSKIFDFWGQTIDVSDQDVFILKDSGLHYEEGKKINVSDLLTAAQRRSGRFLSFMMTVHPYQADPNFDYSCMTCRACVQLPLDVDGIDASIDTQILKPPHILLVHLAALDNDRKPGIGALKKDRGEIFSECCAKSFKENFLHYVKEVLFEMVKTYLKDIYLG